MTATRQALIGVGANLGDRWANITAALARLRAASGVCAVETSPVFESDPVGVLDQPQFLNLVAGVETTLSPEGLLDLLLATERTLGRERRIRWGPRIIDLDLLAYAGETRSTEVLTLPHPRMWERSFVVEPLRALLARPAFGGPAWAELRTRLPASPDLRGLRPWSPRAGADRAPA
ncbi:MAG TPA: 2-amino-4-hydroxy-6-hydroxymethyldihydropteridine diphosphokinase [Lacunisphaera sp.]|jgi:2-amino-4-hydroxy-6-hydroxymethyldihydropteridine diphosphokinase|nr:2-amino-4-hydroxy-6-hydroxymethyldihydropteridine diphosphokinase [Lacunisphaera sp.]